MERENLLIKFYASAGSKIRARCYNNSPWKGAFKGPLHDRCSILKWSVATVRWRIGLCHRRKQGVAWSSICSFLQTSVKAIIPALLVLTSPPRNVAAIYLITVGGYIQHLSKIIYERLKLHIYGFKDSGLSFSALRHDLLFSNWNNR